MSWTRKEEVQAEGIRIHPFPSFPVCRGVLSFPIALRILFAAQPQLLSGVLHIIHRVIAGFLIQQAPRRD